MSEHNPGAYLRDAIKAAGLNVSTAAKLVKISRPTLSNILNGHASLTATTAVRFEKALGVDGSLLVSLQGAVAISSARQREDRFKPRRQRQTKIATPAAINPLSLGDEIIALIYQGPLESPPWRSFLAALRARMNCETASISLVPSKTGAVPISVWDTSKIMSEAEIKQAKAVQAELAHLDILANATRGPGSISTIDEIMPRRDLIKTEYYQRLMKPYGIEYMLSMSFAEPNGWECQIGLMNGADRQNFGTSEKKFFDAFRPHLERSLEIYARLTLNESEKEIFEDALNRLTIGVFILDGQKRMVHSNESGRQIVKTSTSITLVNRRLVLMRADDTKRLNLLIDKAIASRRLNALQNYAEAMRIEDAGGEGMGILVRAVVSSNPYQSTVSPAVTVYISNPSTQLSGPQKLITQLFNLTPTEALLATLLANAESLSDAAEKLQITVGTARSHMKRIFVKTGTRRQSDLVRLIFKSVALLG